MKRITKACSTRMKRKGAGGEIFPAEKRLFTHRLRVLFCFSLSFEVLSKRISSHWLSVSCKSLFISFCSTHAYVFLEKSMSRAKRVHSSIVHASEWLVAHYLSPKAEEERRTHETKGRERRGGNKEEKTKGHNWVPYDVCTFRFLSSIKEENQL